MALETHYPQSKEIAQALSLIAQHGMEAAKHIVDFALTQRLKRQTTGRGNFWRHSSLHLPGVGRVPENVTVQLLRALWERRCGSAPNRSADSSEARDGWRP